MATKPHLLICCTPVFGHVSPVRAIARALIASGFNVTFLTGSDYKAAIESIGATFVPLRGDADLTAAKVAAGFKGVSSNDPAALHDPRDHVHKDYFVGVIPEQYEGVRRALISVFEQQGEERQVVVLVEGNFRGALPGMLGAGGLGKGIRGFVGIGIIPICLSSFDTAPFGHLLLPDSSAEGREKNTALNKTEREVTYGSAQNRFKEVLRELGARYTNLFMRDANYLLVDRFVQMCAPSFEYPRSDGPDSIVFAGGLPPGLRDPLLEFPEWWGDILGKGTKKVVFVAQGTISMNPNDLIIPTMMALKDKIEIIVVVALGKKDTSLPEEFSIPDNVRIADFIPYDEMLEYTDVFVSNAGYGAVQHSLGHGVPQVVAGVLADKGENAMRIEWSGVGVNLRTDKPNSLAVERAVMEVLGNVKYKKRSKEIYAEIQGYDPIGVVIENIEAVARR